ncbi:MAG: hypothetical protein HC851_23595 [Acaryochloris sp. RU_4_1]|nr:hypothetical protein [Acaryochloris sp. RU_4_1]
MLNDRASHARQPNLIALTPANPPPRGHRTPKQPDRKSQATRSPSPPPECGSCAGMRECSQGEAIANYGTRSPR